MGRYGIVRAAGPARHRGEPQHDRSQISTAWLLLGRSCGPSAARGDVAAHRPPRRHAATPCPSLMPCCGANAIGRFAAIRGRLPDHPPRHHLTAARRRRKVARRTGRMKVPSAWCEQRQWLEHCCSRLRCLRSARVRMRTMGRTRRPRPRPPRQRHRRHQAPYHRRRRVLRLDLPRRRIQRRIRRRVQIRRRTVLRRKRAPARRSRSAARYPTQARRC